MGRIIIADGLDKNSKSPIQLGLAWANKLNEKPFILHGDKLADYETLDSVFAHLNLEVHQNYLQSILEANRASIARQLEQIQSPVKGIEFDSRSGEPSDVIIAESQLKDVELIVIGHDDKKSFSKLFLGSVTESIIHKSSKSVLIAKDERALNPKKIMVAYDFSFHCDESIDWAKKLANSFNSEIELVNVVPCYYEGYHMAHAFHNGLNEALDEVIEDKIHEVESRLAQKTKDLKEDGFIASSVALVDKEGSISNKMIEYINENNFDLVIMGTHGRGKIGKLFLGSVANKMIRKSPISILITK